MQLLADMDGLTFIPIHAITKFEIECMGPFFGDTVNDCNTEEEFASLYGDCGGYAELVAYTASTHIRLLREPITANNFKTYKVDITHHLEAMMSSLNCD